MNADFNSVEAELREIEADFASGRMNAFGSAQAQDAFLRELKRIAEIETQVFYKTCSILKSGNTADHAMLTNIFASAQPPPQARGASTGRGGGRAASPGKSTAPRTSLSAASFDSTAGAGLGDSMNLFNRGFATPGIAGAGFPSSTEKSRSAAAPHIKSADWSNETGFPDKAFEDVAGRFQALEADFSVLGDQLRQISKHVMQLNVMSEEVNRNGSGSQHDGFHSGRGDVDDDAEYDDRRERRNGGSADSGSPNGTVGDTVSTQNRTAYW